MIRAPRTAGVSTTVINTPPSGDHRNTPFANAVVSRKGRDAVSRGGRSLLLVAECGPEDGERDA